MWDTGYEPEMWPDRETYNETVMAHSYRVSFHMARLLVVVVVRPARWLTRSIVRAREALS